MNKILSIPEKNKNSVQDNPSLGRALVRILKHMGPFAAIGLSGALLIAKLFEELAEGIFRNKSSALDNRFGLWVHSWSNPFLDLIFKFFSLLGGIFGVTTMTLLGFGLLVRRNHPHGAWLLVLTSGGGVALDQLLKLFYHRKRPELWATSITRPTSYSFPSGHATASLCFGGGLCWLGYKFIKSPLALAGCIVAMLLFVFMVGLSRIYRGVHYLTDVVGGYLCGSFWLALLLTGVSIYDRLHPEQMNVNKKV